MLPEFTGQIVIVCVCWLAGVIRMETETCYQAPKTGKMKDWGLSRGPALRSILD